MNKDDSTTGAQRPGKILERLDNPQQTLKMARYFGKQDISRAETLFGVLSAIIIYGTGIGFLFYLLYLVTV